MSQIKFSNAYFIKLGRGGIWEDSSIAESKLRIGWKGQTVQDIHNGEWEIIRVQLEDEMTNQGAVTRDLNALKIITESTPDDIWITFHSSKLWWCRLKDGLIKQDDTSKYRELSGKWSNENVNSKKLYVEDISGKLSKIQGFRGTVCSVNAPDDLFRLLNAIPSNEYDEIQKAKKYLCEKIEKGIRLLHWKDFETLVDLIFRQSGWKRISMLGGSMKYTDLVLQDSITKEKYQVQVKSKASYSDFLNCCSQFNQRDYKKLYFVVHTPDISLRKVKSTKSYVELLRSTELAEIIVDLGLSDWVSNRIYPKSCRWI